MLNDDWCFSNEEQLAGQAVNSAFFMRDQFANFSVARDSVQTHSPSQVSLAHETRGKREPHP